MLIYKKSHWRAALIAMTLTLTSCATDYMSGPGPMYDNTYRVSVRCAKVDHNTLGGKIVGAFFPKLQERSDERSAEQCSQKRNKAIESAKIYCRERNLEYRLVDITETDPAADPSSESFSCTTKYCFSTGETTRLIWASIITFECK